MLFNFDKLIFFQKKFFCRFHHDHAIKNPTMSRAGKTPAGIENSPRQPKWLEKKASHVTTYEGNRISFKEAKILEEKYAKIKNHNCYMYFYEHRGKKFW